MPDRKQQLPACPECSRLPVRQRSTTEPQLVGRRVEYIAYTEAWCIAGHRFGWWEAAS